MISVSEKKKKIAEELSQEAELEVIHGLKK